MKTEYINCLPITPKTYKQLAKNVALALDTPLPIKHTAATEHYTRLLEYTTHRPTIGMIASHNVFTKNKLFPLNYQTNENTLKNLPTIKYLQKILDNQIKELYPKTAKARQYIIEDNRLQIDKVTKSKGYNLLDKLKIFFKL